MPFDLQLSIAELDLASGTDTPDLSNLRQRYPELGFVFDTIESQLHQIEVEEAEHYEATREAQDQYQRELDVLESRVQDMRLAFNQIRELTVDAEITRVIEAVL